MLDVLHSFAREGCDRPTVREIAARGGVAKRTAQYGLRDLEGHHWVATHLRKVARRFNEPNRYVLLLGRSMQLERALRSRQKDDRIEGGGANPCTHSDPSSIGPYGPSAALGVEVVAGADLPLWAPITVAATNASPKRIGQEDGDPETRESRDADPDLSDTQTRQITETSQAPTRLDPKDPEADLDQIGSAGPPSEARAHSTVSVDREVRATLEQCGLGDLAGGGYERRLSRLFAARRLAASEFKHLIAEVGAKRERGVFDAAGKPTKWLGDPTVVRGYVYQCLLHEPVRERAAIPQRDAGPLRSRWYHFGEPRRLDAPTASEQVKNMNEASLSPCAKQVLDALKAAYHGERSLQVLATPEVAHRLSMLSEEGACGGRLTTEDVLAVIRQYGTFTAFKLMRGDIVPQGAIDSFLRKELRMAKRGCAAEVNARTSGARFIPARAKGPEGAINRQPGTGLKHLDRPKPVAKPEDLERALREMEERRAQADAGLVPEMPRRA